MTEFRCVSYAPNFHKEMQLVKRIRDEIMEEPYTGLRSNLPARYRVATQLRPIFTALLYYGNTLTNQKDRDNWVSYAVSGVETYR